MSQGIRATLHYLTSACAFDQWPWEGSAVGTPATVSQCPHCYRELWRLPALSDVGRGIGERKKKTYCQQII